MNGMLLTHIQRNGQIFLKIIITVLAILLFVCGCSLKWWVGDGRGDWTVDLYEGYSISKINSYEIIFGYKESPESPGGSIIIPNYYVTAYQICEPYVCLEGIHTQKITISDEELKNRVLSYYIVDTTDGGVIGPFESDDTLVDYCNSLALEISDKWVSTND